MGEKYHIHRLYICNFKPFAYGDNPEKPYVTIDFTSGGGNIRSMILSGPNGYGKTSIFQAIYFTLTGIVEVGEYADRRKTFDEHIILNDISKCCFTAVEFVDNEKRYVTLIRYAEKGKSGKLKDMLENNGFHAYIVEGKFVYKEFVPMELKSKSMEEIAERFGEKNIQEWVKRNYIQQEHNSDIILKSDKDRLDFLNILIDTGNDEFFRNVEEMKKKVDEKIETLKTDILDLQRKVKQEIKEVQGEEPACQRVYPEIDLVWDKSTYGKDEPFSEYEEHAKRMLSVIENLSEYGYKRRMELLTRWKTQQPYCKYFILSLYDEERKNKYTQSFAKKKYFQQLLSDEKELLEKVLNTEYLGETLTEKIQQMRQKYKRYCNNLDERQALYKRVTEFRNHLYGKEEILGTIFDAHCPLCGTNFTGRDISLTQAIQQSQVIIEEASKILDTTLEEQADTWRTELSEVKAQIASAVAAEEGEKTLYDDIYSMNNFRQQALEFGKILSELYQLEEMSMLSPFLDKDLFHKTYVQISEYQKAENDLKAAMEIFSKVVERESVSDGGQEKELDMLAYDENKDIIVSLFQMDMRVDMLKEKVSYLAWKRREKLASNYITDMTAYEKKLEEIENLYVKQMKLQKVMSCKKAAKKEYLNDIMKYLEIPMYIYSGKLIQTHQNGLGVFCFTGSKEDALTEFKLSTNKVAINQKLDVSNKFSTGQKNVTNIALMLALKKIATTSLDIFMIDDPCQSLDELNVASFVEIIKNEFTDTQVILSTHEDKIASYIKYKNDKAGKEIIMYNVQDELYNTNV